MSAETIEEWANRVGPTLSAKSWAALDAGHDQPDGCQLHTAGPDGGEATPEQRAALFAYRKREDDRLLRDLATQQTIRANYITLNADGTITTVVDWRAIYRSPRKQFNDMVFEVEP